LTLDLGCHSFCNSENVAIFGRIEDGKFVYDVDKHGYPCEYASYSGFPPQDDVEEPEEWDYWDYTYEAAYTAWLKKIGVDYK